MTKNTGYDISFFNNSPYSWGCFRCWDLGKTCPDAFPTHVGVFLLGQPFGKGGRVMVQFIVDVTVQALANLIATLIITLITH